MRYVLLNFKGLIVGFFSESCVLLDQKIVFLDHGGGLDESDVRLPDLVLINRYHSFLLRDNSLDQLILLNQFLVIPAQLLQLELQLLLLHRELRLFRLELIHCPFEI